MEIHHYISTLVDYYIIMENNANCLLKFSLNSNGKKLTVRRKNV